MPLCFKMQFGIPGGQLKRKQPKRQQRMTIYGCCCLNILLTSGFITVYTEEELNESKVEHLRKLLSEIGVLLSAGSCRKSQLIQKVIFFLSYNQTWNA